MARDSRNRNPVVAAVLTLRAPGLGHLYAGRTTAAAVAWLLPHWLPALIIAAVLLHVGAATFWGIVLFGLATIVAIMLHAGLAVARAPRPYQLQPYDRWWLYLLLATCFLFVWRPGLRRAMWRPLARPVRLAWAITLAGFVGLSALVWGPPQPHVALLFVVIALLLAWVLIWALGPAPAA